MDDSANYSLSIAMSDFSGVGGTSCLLLQVDGNYVLAAVATGVIASVVAASLAEH